MFQSMLPSTLQCPKGQGACGMARILLMRQFYFLPCTVAGKGVNGGFSAAHWPCEWKVL